MFFILILIIGFYFYKTGELQRWMGNASAGKNSGDAKGVLDLRLAKGEISVEEHEKIKNIL